MKKLLGNLDAFILGIVGGIVQCQKGVIFLILRKEKGLRFRYRKGGMIVPWIIRQRYEDSVSSTT